MKPQNHEILSVCCFDATLCSVKSTRTSMIGTLKIWRLIVLEGCTSIRSTFSSNMNPWRGWTRKPLLETMGPPTP